MKSQKVILLLFVIPITIFGKTILITDDPKLDYDFHDEGKADTQTVTKSETIDSTTIKATDIEIEENLIDSRPTQTQNTNETIPGKPEETKPVVGTGPEPIMPICSMDLDKFNIKISQIVEKFVPVQLKLKDMWRGNLAKFHLQNGKLNINKDYKIVGQPVCTEIDDKTRKYEIMLSFNDLMGSYDWKIYNLFGYNFSESAIITVKQVMTELIVGENSVQRTKLKDINIGIIDGLEVKVNIPERITSINYLKPMLEYIISRISTIIANGSIDTIVKNMKDVFLESIQERVKINP